MRVQIHEQSVCRALLVYILDRLVNDLVCVITRTTSTVKMETEEEKMKTQNSIREISKKIKKLQLHRSTKYDKNEKKKR